MKVYLATPMNGRSIEAVKEKIADCASSLAKTDIDFFNPFLEMTANDNSVNGIVKDKKPIEMLCNSAKHIEECDGVLFIGSKDELKQSSGCQVEILIAVSYGKDCFIYENGEVSRLVELELIWSFGKVKERLS